MLKCLPMLVCGLILAVPMLAQAGPDTRGLDALREEFNTQPRQMRDWFLENPGYTLLVDETVYPCHIPVILRRLGRAGEGFRLRKVATKDDRVHVELETMGKRRVRVIAQDHLELSQAFVDHAVRQLLSDIFEFGDAPPTFMVGHRGSRAYHRSRCNHLPGPRSREAFDDAVAAEAAGYHPCPICFDRSLRLPYPNYLGHRLAALQELKQFELLFPPSTDALAQERLSSLGQHVIDTWILPLAGFDYEFKLLQSEWPVAGALGTGLVMVSEGLLAAAESDEELLFVLAHEIAHCELHLPPLSPVEAQHANGELRGYEYWAARWGFAQDTQLVADLVALSWFQGRDAQGLEVQRAAPALAKTQQLIGATEHLGREPGQGRGLYQRLQLFDEVHYRALPLDVVFHGFDGEDDCRAEVRLLGIENAVDYPTLFMLVTVTDAQQQSDSLGGHRGGEIKYEDGSSIRMRFEEAHGVPGYSTLVRGSCDRREDFERLVLDGMRGVDFDPLGGIKRWGIVIEDDS